MKKILIILSIIAICFACKKQELDCEKNNTFSLEVTNGSNDRYAIYVNNEFQTNIEGKKKVTLNLKAGFVKVSAKQLNGYILYPTEKYWENTVEACENSYLVVP